ncbi:hypothetical protein FACS1894127_0740 [Clostridia bacterium]|nr:hypothetical protein FACS1894127_0740 [Clostridia bacterium]
MMMDKKLLARIEALEKKVNVFEQAEIRSAGMMSNVDILKAMRDGELIITPFDLTKYESGKDNRLTPAGFNFSFSQFIVSRNEKVFCTLMEEETKGKVKIFFELKPGDTALALTRESIWVSNELAGTFHSKVTYVSQGLGHISTTLDPGWRGQLLISINNPNIEPIKVVIGERTDVGIQYCTFITLSLYRLISRSAGISDNYSEARIDILYDLLQQKGGSLTESVHMLQKKISENQRTLPESFNHDRVGPDDRQMFIKLHDEVLKEIDRLDLKIMSHKLATKRVKVLHVKCKKLHADAILPSYAREGDSGLDLAAVEDCLIASGEVALIHTGVAIELPNNSEAQIRPRSGLAIKHGISVLNTPGTIDQGYRGEICVILINHGKEEFRVEKHMKIAQMVVKPTCEVVLEVVDDLEESVRGDRGFGSTGLKQEEILL